MQLNDRQNILIVDDDQTHARILEGVVNKMGFNTFVAVGGEEALEEAEERIFDMVLLDVMMPEMDGFETCKRIKTFPAYQEVPVIFITSLNDIQNKIKGFKVGAADYITKPIQQDEVKARVTTHIRLYQLQKEMRMEIKFCQQLKDQLEERSAQLERNNKTLRFLTGIDDLTHIANRYLLDESLKREWARALREQQYIGLMFLAIDQFSDYIHAYGGELGKTCLQKVASVIKEALKRPGDLAGRYTKEYFMAVLPNTPHEGAIHVAKIIQKTIQAIQIEHSEFFPHKHLTLSLGIVCLIPQQEYSIHEFFKSSTEALQNAKDNGYGQIIIK